MACSDKRKASPKEDRREITPIFAKALERYSQQLKEKTKKLRKKEN